MENSENHKKNLTVILVDNSSIDNFVNTKILTRYQFADDVIIFTKSRKALEFLSKLNPLTVSTSYLLFLDLDMPEIDGFEFLNTFNLLPAEVKKHIKIAILTNSFTPGDCEICAKSSAVVAFFNKPLIKSNLDILEGLLLQATEAA